ncbi:MAG: cell filamentation protein Fic [Alphaproteobacteria bacterium 41-28]|nr:MAG: cell filamentation protein Fic [Alphaproteobacteria bacterium 41-28]
MPYKPPFSITPRILALSQSISHALGVLEGEKLDTEPIKLRRENNIKTVQSSLAIEGNSLNLEQVTSLFEGKRVIGPKKDIVEVQNAIALYNKFDQLNPTSMRDFLSAHAILMKDLIKEKGKWREGGVGIFKGHKVAHLAPPAKRVPKLMEDLFEFIKKDKDTPWLLKACIFHYELEFIHPFMDGNGRMGRLWQQLILAKENPIFKFITVEELIRENQKGYYQVLSQCDKEGNSTKFIEFALGLILKALQSYRKGTSVRLNDAQSRLQYARKTLEERWFSRKEYMDVFKNLSTSTASRDLKFGVDNKILEHRGSKNQVTYRYLVF